MALSGGVGGAKLALGLCDVLSDAAPGSRSLPTPATTSSISVSRVCPDLDTLTYTLAGLANPETGWGRAGESGTFMEALARSRRRDLVLPRRQGPRHPRRAHPATAGRREPERGHVGVVCVARHPGVRRAHERRSGADHRRDGGRPARLSALFRAGAVSGRRCWGSVYEGAEQARASAGFLDALAAPDLGAVIICPSNPFISIDPILAVPGVRAALEDCRAPVIAVSPDHRRARRSRGQPRR